MRNLCGPKSTKIDVTTELISRTIQTNGSNTVKDNLIYSFRYKDEDLKLFPINDEQTFNTVEARLQSDSHFFTTVVSIFVFNSLYVSA